MPLQARTFPGRSGRQHGPKACAPADIMHLDDAQQQRIRQWVEQGLQPADLQKRLADELGLRLTYMEVRFLLDDLKLKPKDKEVVPPQPLAPPQSGSAPVQAPVPSERAEASAAPPTASEAPTEGAVPGEVSVTVDQVTRAGAVVSGRVRFSDGQSAEWYLDQLGRLGLAPAQKGYRPSQEDVMAFQVELQNAMAQMGF